MKRIIIVVLVLLFLMCFAYAQAAEEKSNTITLELRGDKTFVETIYFVNHEKTVVYSGTYSFDSSILTLNATTPVERQFVFDYILSEDADSITLSWDNKTIQLTRKDHTAETTNANHIWDDGIVTTAPTCVVEGIKTQTCLVCGATKTSAIPATGHFIVDGVCSKCGSSTPSPFSISRSGELKVKNKNLLPEVVEIPEAIEGIAVTSIGSYAFQGCSKLSSVSIPDSVIRIGGRAFLNCVNLESVSIPDSVSQIDVAAFGGCNKLENFFVDSDNQFFCSESGILFNNDKGIIVSYPSAAGDLMISDSIKTIYDGAFYGCKGLTRITVSHSVTDIGWYAFSNCSNLVCVIIPDSVTRVDSDAFAYCEKLTSIEIPNTVTKINPSTFEGCSSLVSIVVPASVTQISLSALRGCSLLEMISVDEENPNFFAESGALYNKDKSSLLLYPAAKGEVSILNSVSIIGESCFSECSDLTGISIPNSVKKICESAFFRCLGLTGITIPESIESIGWGAFRSCENLATISFTGTKDQWKAVSKGEKWSDNVPATVVHCSDGDVEITNAN